MNLVILISGIIAVIFFLLSGISLFLGWSWFRIYAIITVLFALTMFILMILRRIKEDWTIGGWKGRK
jgi:hypothetical protein